MKKLIYAVMLLLGLSMIVSCDEFTRGGGGSSSDDSYYFDDPTEQSNSSQAYSTNSRSNSTTTFSYQSDIMPYLRSYKFVASNGDYLTFTNSYIRNGQGGEIGVTQYEILGWDSETALINAHTPYGTPPITIYVYADKGYIIIDDVMYFAK